MRMDGDHVRQRSCSWQARVLEVCARSGRGGERMGEEGRREGERVEKIGGGRQVG